MKNKEVYYNPKVEGLKKLNPLFNEVEESSCVQDVITCRFSCKEHFDEFCKKNGLDISNNTSYLNFKTMEFGTRRDKPKNTDFGLFESKPLKKEWEKHWLEMPEYISNNQYVYAQIDFTFLDINQAESVLEQAITYKTKSAWFPKLVMGKNSKLRVVGGSKQGEYPIYVVSKNRYKNCTTSKYLSQMEVEHFVVVEPKDYPLYVDNVANDYATILELDMKYQKEYDTFDELGDARSKGPGSARNFCWDDSIKRGFAKHWVMDDNANEGFHCMNKNIKRKSRTGAMFKAAEDFVDRYSNVAISGLNYTKFCPENANLPPYITNTRIYSFLLIRNDIPYRWRGRYNEDTDICLRVLKDGWCTIQFNAFLAGKCTTQRVKGGNTEEFYSKEGTYPKSKMIEDMHPDVARVVWRFRRWHHYVDYSGYKQKLIYKEGLKLEDKINNYGMVTIQTNEENTDDTRIYLENKYKEQITKEEKE